MPQDPLEAGAVDPASPPEPRDLAATDFLDHGDAAVRQFIEEVTAGTDSDAERAAAIFAAVRDRIWYDPHHITRDRSDYRASAVLAGSQRWCVPKAVLLVAGARAAGIPARLGFADVRNHLQSKVLAERMGTDVFHWHGYGVLWIDRRWLKASPAFNAELCARFGTEPLQFDGQSDALLHAFAGDGRRYMEYTVDRGVYSDLPLDTIFADFDHLYGGTALGSGPIDDPAFAPAPGRS
ncbi:MAG TPA: transglutaminase family protein [Acidimicrobiales bacterium]|nr:transglutaminase family protein [Acidimicrobiales bacterium]